MMGGCRSGFQLSVRTRDRAAHLGRRLVLAQPLIDDLAQQVVIGPGEELHLGNQLGPHPMHAAGARRRDVERHFISSKRLQGAPQPHEFGGVDTGAGAAGIDQPSVGIVIGEQRAEPRPPAFGIGPSHYDKFLAVGT
jgi:hypothetical protein